MKKIGLCLSGGGGKGAYQIGAAKALEDLGLYQQITAFSGTSIGAANAAILVSSTIENAKQVWYNIPDNAIKPETTLRRRFLNERFKLLKNGIYSMDMFDEKMTEQLNDSKISQSKLFITISEVGDESKGVFELFKSSYKHFRKKDNFVHYIALHNCDPAIRLDVVKASCSIPIVFSPVTIHNMHYYDGGLFDSIPVLPLVEEGCKEIYVIDIASIKQKIDFYTTYPDVTFHIITPSTPLEGVLDFSLEHAKAMYQQGYHDTMQQLTNKDHLSN